MPQAASISMYRGQTIEIPLNAQGRAPSQLRFFIRSQPLHGKLGEVRIIDKKRAVVSYTHNDREGVGSDSFTFAAQSQDSPVSAAAQVTITITEKPPDLTAPSSVNFGTVLLGETHAEQITILNSGGGELSGRLAVSGPWKIAGPAEYRLGRMARQDITVTFAPTEEGNTVGQLTFSGDQSSPVFLVGKGVSPLEVSPEGILEFSSSDSLERSASFSIRNLTEKERTVRISAPAGIVAPGETILAPESTQKITLKTAPGFKSSLEDNITLQSGGFSLEIPCRVFAIPPILAVEPSSSIDFGSIQLGRLYKKSFVLKNEGGLNANLVVKTPPGILLIPDPRSTVLPPGAARSFEITFQPDTVGPWKGTIAITTPDGASARLEMNASIPATTAHTAPLPLPSTSPSASVPASKPTPLIHVAPESLAPLSSVRPISELVSSRIDHHQVELAWRKTDPRIRSYTVEWRNLTFSNGEPLIRWEEWKDVSFTESGDLVTASFLNLPAGHTWIIRIRSIDEAGLRSAPSEIIRFSTIPLPPFRWGLWLGGAGALALISLLVIYIRRRQLLSRAAEDDRIRHLEDS